MAIKWKNPINIKYNHCDEVIDILIKNVDDMFMCKGYIYSRERKLNSELEKYILNSIKKYPLSTKVGLVVHYPYEVTANENYLITYSIHNHFHYIKKEIEQTIKNQFSHWRINMLIGSLFVILCLILVEVLGKFSHIGFINILKESLLIIGWVALWEPLTFILFGWQDSEREKLYCNKLCTIPVIIEKCANYELPGKAARR